LQNGSVFVATDTALETKLAKWVPSLADDLETVAALQSPQYTTLLRKTVLVSVVIGLLDFRPPPSLTDDPNITFIDNQATFPIDLDPRNSEISFHTQLVFADMKYPPVTLGIFPLRLGTGRIRDNIGNIKCPRLSARIALTYIPYRQYTSTNAAKTVPVTEYGLFGDQYTSADGSIVTGVVHVPGGPLESPAGTTPTNSMLLPFAFEVNVGQLLFRVYDAYYDDQGSNTDSLYFSYNLLNQLPFSPDDGFGDIKDLKQGVFLMFTDKMLRAVVDMYDIYKGVYLREEPYITAWKRLFQFHTFPVVPGTQGLPPTTDINLLTILEGSGTKELQANDGWVM